VMMNSILELYKITKETKYLDFVDNYISYFIMENGEIKTFNTDKHELDSIEESRVLFDLYDYTKKDKYLKAIEFTYNEVKNEPRTAGGSFYHKLIYKNQVWLDGFYMVMPFYIKYLNYIGINNYQDIISQYKVAESKMKDKNTGLYYHGYDASKEVFWADKKTGLSKSFWLRSIGWFISSLVDSYELINDEKSKEYIKKLFVNLSNSLLNYQDEKTKLFYQVVDKKDEVGNYIETSGSMMIAYSYMKGSRLQMLDESFYKNGKEMFDSCYKNYAEIKDQRIILKNICLSAGLGPENNTKRDGTFAYYINERVVTNDAKGLAPFIMAYLEILRRENAKDWN